MHSLTSPSAQWNKKKRFQSHGTRRHATLVHHTLTRVRLQETARKILWERDTTNIYEATEHRSTLTHRHFQPCEVVLFFSVCEILMSHVSVSVCVYVTNPVKRCFETTTCESATRHARWRTCCKKEGKIACCKKTNKNSAREESKSIKT